MKTGTSDLIHKIKYFLQGLLLQGSSNEYGFRFGKGFAIIPACGKAGFSLIRDYA